MQLPFFKRENFIREYYNPGVHLNNMRMGTKGRPPKLSAARCHMTQVVEYDVKSKQNK